MPRRNRRRARRPRRSRRNGNTSTGPSRAPTTTLKRTFRYFDNVQLNNTTGSGINQYAYYSKYLSPKPSLATGFKDAQSTFEFWRITRFRIRAQPGYNNYNQTYNTINLDALAAMQIWTASDWSTNESVSGISVCSYNNAKVHTLSLNGVKTLVNTSVRINQQNDQPTMIMPNRTWLDTSTDISNESIYSGAQIFAKMPGIIATNYLPEIQLIFEVDVEFKQPAYQNRPTSFEAAFIGSKLQVIPDPLLPEEKREYEVVSYILNDSGNLVRLQRTDGVPGSISYSQEEFWEVYTFRTSGTHFGNREADYTGPVPRKPIGWVPPPI